MPEMDRASRIERFLDFTVREWLSTDEHYGCPLNCLHRQEIEERINALERVLEP